MDERHCAKITTRSLSDDYNNYLTKKKWTLYKCVCFTLNILPSPLSYHPCLLVAGMITTQGLPYAQLMVAIVPSSRSDGRYASC